MSEAIAVVRAELGPEALILASRRIGTDVEVTAAVERTGEALPQSTPGRADALAWHGVPRPLDTLLADGPLEDAIARTLSFAPLPLNQGPAPLLLAGPPGAGKTLTLVKLATRLTLAGVQPVVASVDTRRAGASDQLAAFMRVLRLPLILMSDPSRLAATLARRAPGQPALIDTPGINPLDPIDHDEFAAWATATEATIVLVLPSGLDPAEAADCAGAFAALGATLLLPTRLDVFPRLGGTLAAAHAGRLALTEAGVGSSPADSITPLNPTLLARRLLQTRSRPSSSRARGVVGE